MSKLIIKRTSEWMNAMSDVGVYLDGEKIGVISNGETKEFEIASGAHQLGTRIDWCGSKTMNLNLKETENQSIELSSFKYGKWLMPIFLLGFLLFGFNLLPRKNLILPLIVMIPISLYVLYHITFGHNQYLRLRKI